MQGIDIESATNELTYAVEYPHDIIAVDADFVRPRMAAAYIVRCGDQAVIVETGTNHTVPHLLTVMQREGIAPEQVAYIMPTHVHLDHAGGVGSLMQHLPKAELLVHPRGLRHLVDPERLEQSSRKVYGDAMFERMYGSIIPAPAERTRAVEEGERVSVGGREFIFSDTPGHAKHHYCVWDETSQGWFSGDTFGLSYRELDTEGGSFIFPTTTPIHFDPQALRASIDKLMSRQPKYMYLTHFGRVEQPPILARQLLSGLDRLVAIAESAQQSHEAGTLDRQQRGDQLRADIRAWLRQALADHGWQGDDDAWNRLLEPDVELNAQGIEFWLDHRSN
ncbi:MAG: MBL fold metallo-hydrolase [Wenzhouxiangellaceae bacterium]